MRCTLVFTLALALGCASDDKPSEEEEAVAEDGDGTGEDGGGDDGGGDEGSGEAGAGDDGAGSGDEAGEDGEDPGPEAGVVELQTRDGLTLVADYAPVGSSGPAIVLLHMIPPSWDRSSYPADFIGALNGAGWTVLNVDRRGAGDSEGVPEEAYTGPLGKWDAEAAVKKLQEDGFAPIGIVGASNGTTTALDYAVWAAGEGASEGAVAVSWLVFLTGGSYTESQQTVETAAELPILYTYSTEERAWSVDQQIHDSGAWRFEEYADGDHGTKMFGTSHAAELTADLIDFAQGAFEG